MKNKWKIMFGVMLFAATASGLYFMKEYNRENSDTALLKPVHNCSAAQLKMEFEKDEDAANTKYNGKVINVSGVISYVENTDSSKKIILTVADAMGGVICEIDKKYMAKITAVKQGDTVSIKGICTGMLMDVILVRCVLGNKQKNTLAINN